MLHLRRCLRGLVLFVAIAAGCSSGAVRPQAATDAGPRCEPGHIYCTGPTPHTCDAYGMRVEMAACAGATPACTPGVGCTACQARSRECDPENPSAPRQCADDGSAWVAEPACDSTARLYCDAGYCTDTCNDATLARSYLGCDYYAVTLANPQLEGMGGHFPFAVALGNSHPYPVDVTVEGGELTSAISETVPANDLIVIELPWVHDLAQLCGRAGNPACTDGVSTLRRGGAYHVRSSSPVAAYQFNPLTYSVEEGSTTYYSYTNDASLLLPVPALSMNYRPLPFPFERLGLRGSGGIVAVVGTSDTPTEVTVRMAGDITPTSGTFGPTSERVAGASTGQIVTYTLERGDVLQLVGNQYESDLAGTLVSASAPVAVFGGNTCHNVPFDRRACDHLEEQMIPTEAWGNRYAVSQFIDRRGVASSVRVLALRDDTRLTFEPAEVHDSVTLRAGEVLDFGADIDFVVSGNEPISVVQAMHGAETTEEGDPSLVVIVPTEQYRQEYTVLAPETYTHSYVNIVGPSGTAPVFDGAPTTATETPIGASGLSTWAFEIDPGTHTVRSNGLAYGIYVYGTGRYTSYAYPGGLDLHFINPPI